MTFPRLLPTLALLSLSCTIDERIACSANIEMGIEVEVRDPTTVTPATMRAPEASEQS